jgi:hypothetical protein
MVLMISFELFLMNLPDVISLNFKIIMPKGIIFSFVSQIDIVLPCFVFLRAFELTRVTEGKTLPNSKLGICPTQRIVVSYFCWF